jgi:hypothetical protein
MMRDGLIAVEQTKLGVARDERQRATGVGVPDGIPIGAEVPEIEPLFERWVDVGRNLGSMVARVIVLLDTYGAPTLREVVTEMVARGTHDPGAMAILCEQRRRARGDRPPRVVAFGDHVQERDVVPHDLGGYDE